MKVQEYIKELGLEVGLVSLNEELGIKVKRYKTQEGELILLDYCQINSPKSHPITLECRGLILDADTLEPVCRSFDRFFNHGEMPELSQFEFSKATFVEKADGSLIRVYNYGGEWCIATRGTAFADSMVGDTGLTFKELFLRALGVSHEEFVCRCDYMLNPGMTYMLELSCSENRIVVSYKSDTVTTLGARCLVSGDYVPEEADLFSSIFNTKPALHYSFKGMGELEYYIQYIEKVTGEVQEGVVVYVDGAPVCKMKSPLYVKMHYLRTGSKNFKTGANILLSNESAEYLAYYPEDKSWLQGIEDEILGFIDRISVVFCEHKDLPAGKEYALKVKDDIGSHLLFKAKTNYDKDKEWGVFQEFNNLDLNTKLKLVLMLKDKENKEG